MGTDSDAMMILPRLHRPTLVLMMSNFSHFFAMNSLFAYAAFLCVDQGWSQSIDTAGFFAGTLASGLFAGRLLSSIGWGLASDRYGRRPALLMTLATISVGSLAFALCRNRWAAIAARFIFLGFGNGW